MSPVVAGFTPDAWGQRIGFCSVRLGAITIGQIPIFESRSGQRWAQGPTITRPGPDGERQRYEVLIFESEGEQAEFYAAVLEGVHRFIGEAIGPREKWGSR